MRVMADGQRRQARPPPQHRSWCPLSHQQVLFTFPYVQFHLLRSSPVQDAPGLRHLFVAAVGDQQVLTAFHVLLLLDDVLLGDAPADQGTRCRVRRCSPFGAACSCIALHLLTCCIQRNDLRRTTLNGVDASLHLLPCSRRSPLTVALGRRKASWSPRTREHRALQYNPAPPRT